MRPRRWGLNELGRGGGVESAPTGPAGEAGPRPHGWKEGTSHLRSNRAQTSQSRQRGKAGLKPRLCNFVAPCATRWRVSYYAAEGRVFAPRISRAFLRPSAVRPGRRGGQWNQHLYWWNVFTKSVYSAMADGLFTVDTIYIAIWYHRYNRHKRIVIFYATCGFIKFFSLSITVCLKKT